MGIPSFKTSMKITHPDFLDSRFFLYERHPPVPPVIDFVRTSLVVAGNLRQDSWCSLNLIFGIPILALILSSRVDKPNP